MKAIKLLYRCTNYFGIRFGLSLWAKILTNNTSKIKVPNYKNPFSLRKNTTDIHMFYQIFFNKCYDFEVDPKPNWIIDAGGNIGLASIFFSQKYPEAKIISIEPEKNNYQQLVRNLQGYPNVKTLNAALYNEEGLATISDQGLGESGFVTLKGSSQGQQVQCLTIHGLMSRWDIELIDVLKIDIEGSEKELFSSSYEVWLPRVRCLIIELHDNIRLGASTSFFKAISKYDFKVDLMGENLVFINLDKKTHR